MIDTVDFDMMGTTMQDTVLTMLLGRIWIDLLNCIRNTRSVVW